MQQDPGFTAELDPFRILIYAESAVAFHCQGELAILQCFRDVEDRNIYLLRAPGVTTIAE